MTRLQEIIAQEGDRILREICAQNLVGRSDLLGKSTCAHLVRARRIAIKTLIAAGFSPTQTAKILNRNKDTIRYWRIPADRRRHLALNNAAYARKRRAGKVEHEART